MAKEYGVGLLVGFCERDTLNTEAIYDAAICIDAKGVLMGTYRKVHIFPGSEAHFSHGSAIRPIKFNNINLGVMICADMRSPETARALTVQGAQIIIGLTHWRHDNSGDRERLLPARAVENFLPVIDVNAMSEGEEDGEPYGNSLVFDDRGQCLLRLPGSGPKPAVEIITLTLYPSGKHSIYGDQHFQRRKELYTSLLLNSNNGISIESTEEGGVSDAALHPKYILFLRAHDDHFTQILAAAMATFPKVSSGYIGLVDDVGNLQIRHWKGEPGAFIMLHANEGIAGYVLRTGRTYHWRGDARNPNDPYFIPSDTEVHAELVAPIRIGNGGVAGVILLDSHDENCFDEADAESKLMAHARNLSETLSQAPEKPKRIGLQKRPEEVEEVLRIASNLLNKPFHDASEKNPAQIMAGEILANAMEITGTMRGNIALVEDGSLKIFARQGHASDKFTDINLSAEKTGIKGWVIRNKKAFYAPNVKGNSELGYKVVKHYIPTLDSVLSELAVPLIADDGTAIGVINLESDHENAFQVELSDPGNCESIIGGRHYHLLSALAVIGARVVAISKRHAEYKQREELAKHASKEQLLRFQHAIFALNRATQHCLSGYVGPNFSNQVSRELVKMLNHRFMLPMVIPIYGNEFLQRCLPLNPAATMEIKTELLGGGSWRACSVLLELAIIELISHCQQVLQTANTSKPSIKLILNQRSDPIKLTITHNGCEPKQTIAAFHCSPIDQELLDDGLSTALRIALWNKCKLEKESVNENCCAFHLLIPRS